MMSHDLEAAFRHLFRSVLREVVNEVLVEHRRMGATDTQQRENNSQVLLRSREAAKRLAISERHLWKLTDEGVLPCIRVGRLVRYRVETVEQWVRESESTESAQPKRIVSRRRKGSTATPPKTKTPSKKTTEKSRTKRQSPSATSKKRMSKPAVADRKASSEQRERQSNPFRSLLSEIGVDYDDLVPLTNGELMRIAEVDISVFHGWMYLGRQMPEEALEKLRRHFRKLATEGDEL